MNGITANISLNHSCPLQETIHISSSKLDRVKDYTEGYFATAYQYIGNHLRNEFYLPLMVFSNQFNSSDPLQRGEEDFYLRGTLKYLSTFTEMFRGNRAQVDPTFSHFEKMRDTIEVIDLPVHITSSERTFVVNLRLVQTRDFDQDPNGKRFILFGYNQNNELVNGQLKPWDPRSLEEISTLALELVKGLKEKHEIDSMLCFSLGSLALSSLQNSGDEDILPETIILDRAMSSIEKVAQRIVSIPTILHYLASVFYLDADPETELLQYFESHPEIAAKKTIIAITATCDNYFSKETGYSSNFYERIRKVAGRLYHGDFMLPYIQPRAHHATRFDHIIAHPDTGSHTDDFIPISPSETLSDALANFMFKEGKHTCLVFGGNNDNTDSLLYGKAAPIFNSWLKSKPK